MIDNTQLEAINKVVETFFAENPDTAIIPVKKLMGAFIEAGIFRKDVKNGLPIREILKELDQQEQLDRIPHVFAERNGKHAYWYFIINPDEKPLTTYKKEEKRPENAEKVIARENSNETYIINLCDQVIERKANRRKRFDFLLGDLHKDGVTRTKLPVDAYYHALSLVVEYRKMNAVDEAEEKGPKALARAKQREVYDKRRAEELPKHDLTLVVISNESFEFDENNMIIKNEENNLKVICEALKDFLPGAENNTTPEA